MSNEINKAEQQTPTTGINSRHALDEIIGNLNTGDLIKARIVLSHFSQLEEAVQRRILYELNRRDDYICLALLVYLLVTNPKAKTKYPDIAESILAKALNDPRLILELIRSSRGEEQHYCIELAGKNHLREAPPELMQLLAS